MQHVLAVLLVAMTCITVVNVASRNILHFSLSFTEEIAAGLFMWLVGLGIGVGIREGVHVGMTLLTDKANPATRMVLKLFSLACFTVFLAVVCVFGAQMVDRQVRFGQSTQNLQWPAWIFGAALPLGAVIGIGYIGSEVWRMARGRGR